MCVLRRRKAASPSFDFAVDEASFLRWVKTLPDPIEVQPVKQSVNVRYCAETHTGSDERMIHHGWYHTRRSHADDTECVDYAYDAEKGRAY